MELVDWDWTQDGKRVTLVAPRGRDSLTISRMDVPSARITQVGVMPRADYVVLETVAGGGEILIPTQQSFRRFDIPGLADSTFSLPAALGSVVSIDPSPDGKAFVSISWDPTGDSLLANRVSIVDGSVTRLGAFGAEGSQPPKWFDDGSIRHPDSRDCPRRSPGIGFRRVAGNRSGWEPHRDTPPPTGSREMASASWPGRRTGKPTSIWCRISETS